MGRHRRLRLILASVGLVAGLAAASGFAGGASADDARSQAAVTHGHPDHEASARTAVLPKTFRAATKGNRGELPLATLALAGVALLVVARLVLRPRRAGVALAARFSILRRGPPLLLHAT